MPYEVKIIRANPSESAGVLGTLLGIKRNLLSRWEPRLFRRDKVLINWGNTKPFNTLNRLVLNKPENVKLAVWKHLTFLTLDAAGVRVPPFYMNAEQVPARTNSSIYVARSILNGHSGKGITIVRNTEAWPEGTKIITKYIKKKIELRVHVAFGKVILTIQKRKSNGHEAQGDDNRIRSFDNGWIFSNNVDPLPEGTEEEAVKAVAALGLDFGAVDLVVESGTNLPYILEVNTAPALKAETTKAAYKKIFTEVLDELER